VAKIQTNKFIGSGSIKGRSPVAEAVNTHVTATNNLNKTLVGISSVVEDLYKIELGFVKNEKQRAQSDRRKAQRAQDQKAEDRLEERAAKKEGKKGLSSKLKKTAKKGFMGAFGWLTQLISPIATFLAAIGGFAIASEVMKWIGDPENAEKLKVFLDKALFVFDKLYGWISGFTINIIDGWSDLFAEDGDFGTRLSGLGQMMTGIIGLKYLMNPFSLITDILGLLDILDRDKPDKPPIDGKPDPDGKKPRVKPGEIDPATGKPRPKRTGLLGALDSARDRASNLGERFRTSKFNPFADNRSRLDRYYDDATGYKPNALQNLRDNASRTGRAISDDVAERLTKVQIKGKPLTDVIAETSEATLSGMGLDKERRQAIRSSLDTSLEKLTKKKNKIQGGIFSGLQTLQRNLTFQEGSTFRKGAARAGQELTFAEGSTSRKAASATGKFLGEQGTRFTNAIKAQYGRFNDWAGSLPDKARNALMERILKPILSAIEPVMNTVKGVGGKITGAFGKLGFVPKILEALKKKGISGFTDIKGAAKELGPTIWPIIGSVFSLISGYDRLTNQDPTGALMDTVSGLFELSVAPPPVGFAFLPGSGISTFIDIAMLGRDLAGALFPDFDPRTEEDKLINNLGLGSAQTFVKSVGAKLPKLSALTKIFGEAEKEGPKREDFKDGDDGDKDFEEAKQAWLVTQPDGKEEEINADAQASSLGGPIREPQELFLGGVVKGIGKAIGSVGKTVSNVLSNPIVSTGLSLIPGAAPIVGAVSGIANLAAGGNPLGAIMSGVSMIPGVGQAMGGFGDFMGKAAGIINSPLGQAGTSLLQGNFMGAASSALGMLGGPLAGIGQSLLGGNFGGAISSGLGMVNPMLGQMAGSILSGGFQPMNIISNVADSFGLSGVMQAVTGLAGGDPTSAIKAIGSELGVDPKILGAVDKVSTKALGEKGISAKYAMQQALEFVPIPVVLEKVVPMLQAVPINITQTKVVQATESVLGSF